MAHDNSLPAGDRDQPDAIDPPCERRPAIVVRLANGRYFRAWRPRNGSVVEVAKSALAKLFRPDGRKGINQTLAKLRRKGIAAAEVEVTIVVGQTPGGKR